MLWSFAYTPGAGYGAPFGTYIWDQSAKKQIAYNGYIGNYIGNVSSLRNKWYRISPGCYAACSYVWNFDNTTINKSQVSLYDKDGNYLATLIETQNNKHVNDSKILNTIFFIDEDCHIFIDCVGDSAGHYNTHTETHFFRFTPPGYWHL